MFGVCLRFGVLFRVVSGDLKLFMVDLGLVWELFRVGEDANYGEDV